jgi:GMP synthase-like glutamine amidotransferase
LKKVYIIHENSDWTNYLTKRLDELGVPYEEWHLDSGRLDLSKEPPEGVFYNRMSASSHTRGHRFAPEFTAQVLSWLESHGRKSLTEHGLFNLK